MQVTGQVRSVLNDGIGDGQRRAGGELGGSPSISGPARDLLIRSVERWPGDLSDRFLRDFAEQVTIADIARRHFNHPPLTDEDVLGHLAHSKSFLNSWTHP